MHYLMSRGHVNDINACPFPFYGKDVAIHVIREANRAESNGGHDVDRSLYKKKTDFNHLPPPNLLSKSLIRYFKHVLKLIIQ